MFAYQAESQDRTRDLCLHWSWTVIMMFDKGSVGSFIAQNTLMHIKVLFCPIDKDLYQICNTFYFTFKGSLA